MTRWQWFWWGVIAISGVVLVLSAGALMDASLGTLADWLAGLGTVVAIGGLVAERRRDATARRAAEAASRAHAERAQAELVSVWCVGVRRTRIDDAASGVTFDLRVRNSSDVAVYSVTAFIGWAWPAADGSWGSMGAGSPMNSVAPGETVDFSIPTDDTVNGEPWPFPPPTAVWFTDAGARAWTRGPLGELERRDDSLQRGVRAESLPLVVRPVEPSS